MPTPHCYRFLAVLAATSCAGNLAAAESLRDALVFHAPFDQSVDAEFSLGDAKLYTAKSLQRKEVAPGLLTEHVAHDETGRFGGSLRFKKKTKEVLFFKGRKNVPYGENEFAGTVSLWMRLNPDADLPPGFVDPLQITDKKWNDASFFLDFSKELPRQFRLGVFSEYKFWNPSDRKWEAIPEAERPLIAVVKPPFSNNRWTHVAYTYRGFNTSGDAEVRLYLDGMQQGKLTGKQKFRWDPSRLAMMIGISYVGKMDDLAIFNRALTPDEIRNLGQLPQGIKSLK